MTGEPRSHDPLGDAVRLREERRARWQSEGERSIGQNLAMIGMVGWSVLIPMLLGVLGGRYIDRHLRTGVVFTACLLLVGLVCGCLLAWRRINDA